MIHSPRFVAVLDACVLYPAPIRDLLLHLAALELYTPKWTDRIQEEWLRNLLLNRPDLGRQQLKRTQEAMNGSFPDANVSRYEDLMAAVALPDPDDRHVVAAAIRCQADVIITANLKDFPEQCLSPFDLEAQHPDYFISNLIDLNADKALRAFENQVACLRNPPKTKQEVIGNLEKVGLATTCVKLLELM